MAAAKTEKTIKPDANTSPAEVDQADADAAVAQPDEEAQVREADGSPLGGQADAVIPDKEDSPAKNEPEGTPKGVIAEGPGPAAFPEVEDEAGHQNPSQGQMVTYNGKDGKHPAVVTRTRRTALGQTDGEDKPSVLESHEHVDLTVFGFGKVSQVKNVPYGDGEECWSWAARSEGAIGGA